LATTKAKTSKAKTPMPEFAKAPEELVKRFENAMKNFPMATTRKMFGYPCAFVNGNMFAGLFQEEMFLRLNDEDRAAIRAQYDTTLFEPIPGRPMRSYVLVPHYVLNAPHLLNELMTKSMEYAKTLPEKKQRAKKV